MAQSSKVSGVVQIDGQPAERVVRAYGYNSTSHDIDGETVNLSKSLGHAISDPETGEYTIDLLAGYDKRIFVVAFDDYGADFAPDLALAVGDRIHPTTPNGHVWECTGAGALPSAEPTWILDTETAQLYGTASMIARPFYRPMVHGPVTPEAFTAEVPWTPEYSADTALWFDGADTNTLTVDVAEAGGLVSQWNDKAGTGIQATQADPTRQPILEDFNGTVAPGWNGNGDNVSSTASFTMPANSWVVSLALFHNSTRKGWYNTILQIGDGVLNDPNELAIAHRADSGDDYLYVSYGFRSVKSPANSYSRGAEPPHVLTIVKVVNSFVSIRRDGVEIARSTDSSLIQADQLIEGIIRLGYAEGKSGWASKEDGPIAELVIDGGLIAEENALMHEGYLAHKWGTAAELPVDHPYKEAPPMITPEEPDAGPPPPLYIVGAGFDHSAVLKPDGTVEVWGGDYWGQVSDYPAGLSKVVAVACSGYSTIALKDDGSIVVWGGTSTGERTPPTDGPYVQVAGNAYNGAAVKEDGTLHLWGKDGLSVPASVNTVGCKFVEGWGDFFLAVLNDGSVVRIGAGPAIPADMPPAAFAGAGRNHGYVIFEDGTVQGFGDSGNGQISTPEGFGDCRQIDGGRYHTIALTQGGIIEHWGATTYNLDQVPAGSDFIAISSGKDHCLAVRQDGTVETWGNGDPVPAGVTAKVS